MPIDRNDADVTASVALPASSVIGDRQPSGHIRNPSWIARTIDPPANFFPVAMDARGIEFGCHEGIEVRASDACPNPHEMDRGTPVTPNGNEAQFTVAVSASESPDMEALGLGGAHLREAMGEIALRLLANGVSLAYDGDLRPNGFTELLAELVERYRNHPRHDGTITVTDYLAWPVHIRMDSNTLASFAAGHGDAASLVLLTRDGARLEPEQRFELPTREPDEDEWAEGLTAMRTVMLRETQARVVLGGTIEGFKGAMPGIAEEAHLSLRANQPVFLLGGFGGCVRDIAETIGLVGRWAGSRGEWTGRCGFSRFSPGDLHNGLSREENGTLAGTPHVEEAVNLVSRGLHRIMNG